MPVVVIPTVFLSPTGRAQDYTECRVANRVLPAIIQELFQYHPELLSRFRSTDGRPLGHWFNLFRERDGEDLRHSPDLILDEDERLHLINAIGC